MASAPSIGIERRRIVLRGAVQGVGFRPTVYRIAMDLRLAGWVQNSTGGLELEVEGSPENLDRFLCKLKAERPRAAVTRPPLSCSADGVSGLWSPIVGRKNAKAGLLSSVQRGGWPVERLSH
jgi:hydrogenase maturation protein HypF